MSTMIERPATLQINAWNPQLPHIGQLPERTPWAQVKQGSRGSKWLAPAAPVDQRDWRHPDVGWGLVLPDDDTLALDAKVAGADAPDAIGRLLAARPGSPVLRWQPKLQQNFLRRYYADGRVQDLSIAAPKPGVADGRLPRYLLIYASPAQIPWAVQYALNMSTFVGRLDLPNGDALDHYINALISDWSDGTCRPRAPVVWSVDHGGGDITTLMAQAVAEKVWSQFALDDDLTGRMRIEGGAATREAIAGALAERKPGLVVTTSHGMTGPLDDEKALAAQLGMPVDVNHQPLQANDLAAWQPSGAIWYCHACCSAGSDSVSRYAKLLESQSAISQIINGVAEKARAMVAPLPRALLGHAAPLRAFVGHVEPTFDWTLRDPATKQVLTHVLCKALYTELYQQDRRTPIGFALRGVFDEAGAFFGAWQDAIASIDANVPGMRDWALYRQLVAMDRQTLVIIGDPTVSLPPLR
jgi:hypothetical protein